MFVFTLVSGVMGRGISGHCGRGPQKLFEMFVGSKPIGIKINPIFSLAVKVLMYSLKKKKVLFHRDSNF